ncbi:subclass B1 metallo-beta-lactamase [Dyadobacter frigoris]|uniref:beta-lactamase n=1 Tax=Dyadobacter frigoris TaxID=2576211 RepID=A0A4U6D7D3_9BACT|nr:subclass B1 metallo-beta-lactamase [Dyadobacter frigoris]TKT92147.1 subclass B1 metallo-beta-lactamase [Dyadobacter frigoris]GLU52962.1 beta-lactamase [Dyadobacter frigoris]
MIKLFLFISLCFISECKSAVAADKGITSDKIIIQKVTDNVYQHITYFQSETFGKVPCNGMIVFNKNEAVVFDTPVDDSTSLILINWVRDSLHCKIVAIIPTHFHEDCLGGLAAFHKQGIRSYAANQTIKFAKAKNYQIPQNGFDNLLELKVGGKKVIAEFNGEGHTKDNIIGYFPSDKVMFGGCLIKEIDATKGNLEDANVNAWSETVTKLRGKYPDTKIVIPGHGKTGNTALLDYTIKLFAPTK